MKNSRIVNHYAPIEGPVTVSFFPNLSSLSSPKEPQMAEVLVHTGPSNPCAPLPGAFSSPASYPDFFSGPEPRHAMSAPLLDRPAYASFSNDQGAQRPETPTLSVKTPLHHLNQLQASFRKNSTIQGLLACAVIAEKSGKILAHHSQCGHESLLDKAVLASIQLIRAHRQAAQLMGLAPFDEFTTSTGHCQIILRTSSQQDGIFIMALLDKQHTNLTTARLNLMDIDKQWV